MLKNDNLTYLMSDLPWQKYHHMFKLEIEQKSNSANKQEAHVPHHSPEKLV